MEMFSATSTEGLWFVAEPRKTPPSSINSDPSSGQHSSLSGSLSSDEDVETITLTDESRLPFDTTWDSEDIAEFAKLKRSCRQAWVTCERSEEKDLQSLEPLQSHTSKYLEVERKMAESRLPHYTIRDNEDLIAEVKRSFREAWATCEMSDDETENNHPLPMELLQPSPLMDTSEILESSDEEEVSHVSGHDLVDDSRPAAAVPQTEEKQRKFTFTWSKTPPFLDIEVRKFRKSRKECPAAVSADHQPSTSGSGASPVLGKPCGRPRKRLSRMFAAIRKAIPNPLKCMTRPS